MVTLYLDLDFNTIIGENLRKIPKWLSRCECSFHKGKGKTQFNGENDDKYGAEI